MLARLLGDSLMLNGSPLLARGLVPYRDSN